MKWLLFAAVIVTSGAFLACSALLDPGNGPKQATNDSSDAGVIIDDSFNSFGEWEEWAESSVHGEWEIIFNGYGQIGVRKLETPQGIVLFEKPATSTSLDQTHAALIVSKTSVTDFTLSAMIQTVEQLRVNNPPYPWECAWIIWHHSMENMSHEFYYFAAKPNGWEIGKKDPTYEGGQRFLITGDTPIFSINQWYKVKITQCNGAISVWVNDQQIVDNFIDDERPYLQGSIGFYAEDAYIMVDDVLVSSLIHGN